MKAASFNAVADNNLFRIGIQFNELTIFPLNYSANNHYLLLVV